MDLVPYAIPFFFLAIFIELSWDNYRHAGYYRSNDSINSLSMGLLSTTSKLVMIDIAWRVYPLIQEHLAIVEWPLDGWISLVTAFVAYDFCYYWFHRISHERKILWAAHIAHHQSEEYNLTTALRQTSTGFLFGWIFYIPCFLLGMPAWVFITVASANLVYQFWVHTRFVNTMGPLEKVLVTPMNHRVHHARNPEYIDKNYGGFFIIWDRMFGTYKAENPELPVDFGITRGLNSWNPLWANIHVYVSMFRDTLKTRRLKEKLRIWYGRTDYIAPGIDKAAPTPGNHYDPELSRGQKTYITLQFILLIIASLPLMYLSEALGRVGILALFAYVLLSMVVLGRLLECGRSNWEWIRLFSGLLLITVLPPASGIEWLVLSITLASALFYWTLGHRARA